MTKYKFEIKKLTELVEKQKLDINEDKNLNSQENKLECKNSTPLEKSEIQKPDVSKMQELLKLKLKTEVLTKQVDKYKALMSLSGSEHTYTNLLL